MKKEELESFNLENIQDEDLKCPICHYYFTNNLKPYSLNCNHNLCLKCIDALIEKNMYNCPICRRAFSIEETKKFPINEKYLSFVTQILRLKLIFCIKCQKIYNFIEHYENCDQINFKDSHESFENINDLAMDCLKIIKSSDRHLNILDNSEVSIYEEIHRIMKIININFFEFFNKTLEKFIDGIPKINQEELLEEIFNYLKFYDIFLKSTKVNDFDDSKAKDFFISWIENNINKLPLIHENNGEGTPFKDLSAGEILQYNFGKYKNFKEIKNSTYINRNRDKIIDSENDSDYDFHNYNTKKIMNGDSNDITNNYKNNNLSHIDILFSKHRKNNIEDNKDKLLKNINKFKDLPSIKANKKHEQYNREEDIVENLSNYNSKDLNNKFNKENNVVRKGYSQIHNNEFKDNFREGNELMNHYINNSKHLLNNNANVLSFSIDNILIKNFDKNQKNYIDSRKKSPPNFNTERKNHAGIYSKDNLGFRSKQNETIRSDSADSSYRSKNEKEAINNFHTNINDHNRNNNRRFTNFSDNSNNTHVIENYNIIDHFNNNNVLSDSFSSISNEDLNFIKGNKIKEKIQKNNSETVNDIVHKNENDNMTNDKNDYGSIEKNTQNKMMKNNKNFSFKKSNKDVSKISNETGIIMANFNNDSDVVEKVNKSDNTINDNISINVYPKNLDNKGKEKFTITLRNIKIAKNSDKDFKFIGHGEVDSLEHPLSKAKKHKEQLIHKRSFDCSNLDKNNKNNKEIDLSQRQRIIVRNDQVKIIHNENQKKENKNMTPSKIEIRDNKIRLISNSPNTKFSNDKNDEKELKSINKFEKENDLNDQISINNNISEGALTIKTSYIDKYRLDNEINNKENLKNLNDKKRRSQSKLIDMNALYKLSINTSARKSKNLEDFKLSQNNGTNPVNNQSISLNPYSTQNINSPNKILFLKENNNPNNKKNDDISPLIKNTTSNEKEMQNENIDENIFNIAELKQKENSKYPKFMKSSNRNEFEGENLTKYNIESRHFIHNYLNKISNSPLKNKMGDSNINKIIYSQRTCPNNNTNFIIGRDFQFSSNYKSNNNILIDREIINSEHVSEFPLLKVEQECDNGNEEENILFDNKKFESFREIEKLKTMNKHEAFRNLLEKFNSIKDKVFRITNYSQQIELTSETIRDQISKNYSHLSEKISTNLNGLCDNIVGTNSKNNYYKRIIPNIIENSKKISLFDIKLQTFDIKEFEYLTIKLNVSINIDHDGSDLIFLSGGKVSNSMNFFKGEESFGDLSGQITALFLILRWSTKGIEHNGQLLRKRAWHSSLYFNNKLYIVGGASSESLKLKECECYNIVQKQWELLPNLNYPRCNPGLCIYNQEYLYVFNGWITKDRFLNTIEFININHFSSSSWSTYKPEDPGLSWEGFSNCCAAVAAENKILIFGGYKDEKQSSTYFFDPLKKTVFRGKDLVKPSIFYNNALFFENKIYSVDNRNENRKIFGVHVYEINSNVWKYYQGPQ